VNSKHTLARRWLSFVVIILGFVLILAVVPGKAPRGEKPKADARRAAEMVDAIVNRNKAPKVVEWPDRFPSRAALFPEDYDWKEDARANKAIYELEKDQTEEVWEELVRRRGDERYSTTVTEVNTGDALIVHVGGICHRLAESRLIGVFWQHLPHNPWKEGQKLSLNVGIGDLSEWRKQRAGKSLYELQIEVCEEAIKTLADVKDVPQTQKDQAREKIETEIVNLKKSKKPAHVEGGHNFYVGKKYNAEIAKRVREGVKSGKYEDLDIAPK
jgi:hypothetical protein